MEQFQMTITPQVAELMQRGGVSGDDILSIVASMETNMFIKDKVIEKLTQELATKDAVIEKKNEILYGLTHAGWKVGISKMPEYPEDDELFGVR